MDDPLKQDQERLKLFKKYGYDIPKARDFIIAKARLARGRILEVGTGRGHMAVALAGKGYKVTSIDLDKKAQDVAKANLKALKLDKMVSLKKMNAEKLRFKDNAFDYVVSVNFIHHARDPVRCLKEMIRVSAKKLVIADINKRGERIIQKVRRLEGHSHAESKMPLKEAEAFLVKAGLMVKVYPDKCQTVIIAKRGAAK